MNKRRQRQHGSGPDLLSAKSVIGNASGNRRQHPGMAAADGHGPHGDVAGQEFSATTRFRAAEKNISPAQR